MSVVKCLGLIKLGQQPVAGRIMSRYWIRWAIDARHFSWDQVFLTQDPLLSHCALNPHHTLTHFTQLQIFLTSPACTMLSTKLGESLLSCSDGPTHRPHFKLSVWLINWGRASCVSETDAFTERRLRARVWYKRAKFTRIIWLLTARKKSFVILNDNS